MTLTVTNEAPNSNIPPKSINTEGVISPATGVPESVAGILIRGVDVGVGIGDGVVDGFGVTVAVGDGLGDLVVFGVATGVGAGVMVADGVDSKEGPPVLADTTKFLVKVLNIPEASFQLIVT
jgi:hypothetical protein